MAKRIAKSLKEKNAMECNKRARQKYKEENKDKFKYQSICFLAEELEEINKYCKQNGIPKNRFFRETCMAAIGKSID